MKRTPTHWTDWIALAALLAVAVPIAVLIVAGGIVDMFLHPKEGHEK